MVGEKDAGDDGGQETVAFEILVRSSIYYTPWVVFVWGIVMGMLECLGYVVP